MKVNWKWVGRILAIGSSAFSLFTFFTNEKKEEERITRIVNKRVDGIMSRLFNKDE